MTFTESALGRARRAAVADPGDAVKWFAYAAEMERAGEFASASIVRGCVRRGIDPRDGRRRVYKDDEGGVIIPLVLNVNR